MAAEERYRRDPSWPFQELDGCAVVIVPPRREMHELNEVATFVWRALAEPKSVPELVEAVCGEFDGTPEVAERDLRRWLADLVEKGLAVRT